MNSERFDQVANRMARSMRTRRGVLSVGAGLAAPRFFGPAPTAAKAAVVDARCKAPRGKPQGIERQVVAQIFQARHSGVLVSATVWFTDVDASGTNDFSVAIHTVDRKGRPTARVLAEAPLTDLVDPPTGRTTKATANFTGPSATLGPATVKKGKRYALLVRSFPFLQVTLNQGRCDGEVWGFDGSTGEWERVGGIFGDLVFSTIVAPA
jgi:hypothetical protein